MIEPSATPALRAERLHFEPVAPAERIAVIDALRGFALLGILLMNVEFFSRPLQGLALGFDHTLSGSDHAVAWWVMALVQGKFWTLFSLLFGMGFALMSERALQRGGEFEAVYARRLALLLGIGLLHALLLWAGDILVSYALAGAVMLLFGRNLQVSSLWRLGIVLYLVPTMLLWSITGLMALAALDPAAGAQTSDELNRHAARLQADYASAAQVYAGGSYLEVTRQRLADSLMQYGWLPMILPAVTGIFLLGAWFIRSGVMLEPRVHLHVFRRLLGFGAPAGVLLALVAMPMLLASDPTLPTPRLALGTTLMTLASPLLCLAYASAIVLLVVGPWPALGRWLAPAGRMALSNYLMQSAVFSTLFYGYGFGWWGQVSRLSQLVLVFAFFLLQLLISHLWMSRFRHGPVEWIWRALTYLRLPPLRS